MLLLYDFKSQACLDIVKDLSGNGRDATSIGAEWRAFAKGDAGNKCEVPTSTPTPCTNPNAFAFNGVRIYAVAT